MSQTKETTPTRRSPEERLNELDKKMEQLKAKKQQIQARITEKSRKERTRRLIQVGAIFENQFPNLVDLTLEQVSEVATELGKLLDRHQKAMEENGK